MKDTAPVLVGWQPSERRRLGGRGGRFVAGAGGGLGACGLGAVWWESARTPNRQRIGKD